MATESLAGERGKWLDELQVVRKCPTNDVRYSGIDGGVLDLRN